MASLDVDIVDTEGTVWAGDAVRVVAPAGNGELGILAGHVPVLSVLKPGEIRVLTTPSGEVRRWQVTGGFFSVDSNQVTIVVDDVVPGDAVAH